MRGSAPPPGLTSSTVSLRPDQTSQRLQLSADVDRFFACIARERPAAAQRAAERLAGKSMRLDRDRPT